MSAFIFALGCAGTPQAEPETPTPLVTDAVAEPAAEDAASPETAASLPAMVAYHGLRPDPGLGPGPKNKEKEGKMREK